MNKLLIPLLLFSSIFPNNVGEKLIYKAGFRLFSAGKSTIELQSDTLNGELVYHLISHTETNSFLDRFYKVRDKIDIWVDTLDYTLLKVEKNIREGKYNKEHSAVFFTEDSTVFYDSKFHKLKGRVFDPFSALYFLREQNLNTGQQFQFSIYDNGKIRETVVQVIKYERVSVPAGKFQCLLVSPASADNKSLLKNKGEMRIWFSTDDKKLPVKIEIKTNIGVMKMELTKVE
ncbi:MAG: DUF3108 domain-containing protein [Candidatus Marinimicrobia bacterium]|nr:DUF3108 domain-containing protein [Candidatus Neomarinimicrobiota bacterium]MBL7023391.1 DUF3108 domain-containing protein [Candidatus Neomarinimicrobiota bacterium]MBL7109728.1 DUF3108 domain-containing protein [Candidatus Neomarinimicrobiota bacterium]